MIKEKNHLKDKTPKFSSLGKVQVRQELDLLAEWRKWRDQIRNDKRLRYTLYNHHVRVFHLYHKRSVILLHNLLRFIGMSEQQIGQVVQGGRHLPIC